MKGGEGVEVWASDGESDEDQTFDDGDGSEEAGTSVRYDFHFCTPPLCLSRSNFFGTLPSVPHHTP